MRRGYARGIDPERPFPAEPGSAPGTTGARMVTRGALDVLTWPRLAALGVDVVVTTRRGGVSEGPYRSLNLGLHVGDGAARVVENRRRAGRCLGADLSDMVFAAQVHGAGVAVAGPGDGGRGARDASDCLAEADALVTTAPGVVLVVLVADCVPVVLVEPSAGVLACVHAGWRGVAAGAATAAVDAMVERGARTDRLVAAVGPATSAADYQVGSEVASAVHARLGGRTRRVLVPDGTGRWRLDLVGAVRVELLALGVGPNDVLTSGWTTGGDGPFFSDRAARPCGRFGLLARLRPGSAGGLGRGP